MKRERWVCCECGLPSRGGCTCLPQVDAVPRHERAAADMFTGPEVAPVVTQHTPPAVQLDCLRATQERLPL